MRPAATWHASLRPAGVLAAKERLYRAITFDATPPEVEQPPLLEDVLCIHRGGPKRIKRHRASRTSVHEMPDLALTILPRYQHNRWATEGPIRYTHLVISPCRMGEILESEFSLHRDQIELRDDVGFTDPLLSSTASALCGLAAAGANPGRLFTDALLTSFIIALFRSRSDAERAGGSPGRAGPSGGIAPWRLKQVLDYLEDHILDDPGYDELARLAGCSRSHLFRSFRDATGLPPGKYLDRLRVRRARTLLERGASVGEAAAASGLGQAGRLSRAFLRHFGMTPTEYRRWYR
ncbi:helix-turn-helix domain-containing protein [Sphingomonas sp. PR090111-T3T-6A]|uniref:helix-turn-helix domain-containing protein n=1 Tax=Sphingomonas sp. PR090111-T3T-6A TaxID=685778 RepID=UPI0003708C20|nr:AraC family transcriptional regulator [Sphingomonas sp. PR090111-T3T-6A]